MSSGSMSHFSGASMMLNVTQKENKTKHAHTQKNSRMENLAAVNERGVNCLILAGLRTFEKPT